MTAANIRAAQVCGKSGCNCARPGGNVHCPAHFPDAEPSLSVNECDGRPLVHCFSGCSQQDVIDELKRHELWPSRTDYRMSNGTIHRRIDRPDGQKDLSWIGTDGTPGLKGLHLADFPLFGSEELAGLADGDTVVIAEGEKARDAFRVHGIAAVGTFGADVTPTAAALAGLSRFDAVLSPDNDNAGRVHMGRIADVLHAMGLRPRLLTLPGLPEKGDAADYVGSDDALARLIADAPLSPAAPESLPRSLTPGPMTVCLADVDPEDVQWLWYPYVPLGKLTLLEGDPGVGKSHVSLAIATAVSLGRGLPGMTDVAPANVLILSAEDGLADTVRPRLDAMGADSTRIFAVTGPLCFGGDDGEAGLAFVEAEIARYRPALVVLDPLVFYLGGGVDLHRANEVRQVTARLAALAEKYGCAILAVRHLTKGSSDKAIYRGIGSIDLTAAARSALLVGCDPDDPANRAIAQVKNNLTAFGGPVGFSFNGGHFAWLPTTDLTVGRMLAAEAADEGGSPRDEAEGFLREELADGPRPAEEVVADAKAAQIKETTLKRAKRALRVTASRVGEPGRRGGGVWYWSIDPIKGFTSPYREPVNPLIGFESGDPSNGGEGEPLNRVATPSPSTSVTSWCAATGCTEIVSEIRPCPEHGARGAS